MLSSYLQRLFADPNGAPALVRRLLVEQAAGQWRRYALAFGMMFIAAASTALGTYLIGDVINAAYVDKNLPGIILLALVTATLFAIKGMATYGQSVTMARIGNKIIADNQRRLFARRPSGRRHKARTSRIHRRSRQSIGRPETTRVSAPSLPVYW